jgi:lactate dehydrogenase-like 2-hydroxyacid dehydrogenase
MRHVRQPCIGSCVTLPPCITRLSPSRSISSPSHLTASASPPPLRTATIVITTTIKLDAETLRPSVTPNLRYIAISATGTDPVDLDACRARNIRVTNCPGANIDAVSEHAIGLYFAARRRTVFLDRVTRAQPSEWKTKGSVNQHMRLPDGMPPMTCKDEVMGVIGYGGIGRSPCPNWDARS